MEYSSSGLVKVAGELVKTSVHVTDTFSFQFFPHAVYLVGCYVALMFAASRLTCQWNMWSDHILQILEIFQPLQKCSDILNTVSLHAPFSATNLLG